MYLRVYSQSKGGMGKRAWNSGFAGGMGKRAWNSGFAGGMGKRAWNSGFAGKLLFLPLYITLIMQ